MPTDAPFLTDETRLYTSGEAAAALGISITRVKQLEAEGQLSSIRSRFGRLYRPADVEALVARRRIDARAEHRMTPPPDLPTAA